MARGRPYGIKGVTLHRSRARAAVRDGATNEAERWTAPQMARGRWWRHFDVPVLSRVPFPVRCSFELGDDAPFSGPREERWGNGVTTLGIGTRRIANRR